MKTLLLLLLSAIALPALAENIYNIKEAIDKGYISVTAEGLGGYTGKVLTLHIQSLHKKDLTIAVPAGLQMVSEDTSVQDLIITDDKQLLVSAGSKRKLVVNAMCIQPYNSPPSLGSAFMLGAMATDTLLKVVQYLAQKNYQEDLGQSAVWTIINRDGLENVYGTDPAQLTDLVKYMHTVTGQPLPWYHKEKRPPAPTEVYNPEPAILHATYDFTLPEDGTASLAIYNAAGEVVYTIKENMVVKKGKSMMKFRLEVRGFEKGKYYARLHLNGQLQEEKVFEI